MKYTLCVLALSVLLSTSAYIQADESSCCQSSAKNYFVEALTDKYDCALITFKIRKPTSEKDWLKILDLLQNILVQKGTISSPTKTLKDLDAVLEEIFALDDIHGELSLEFALEKCPCENKAKCSETCDCGALECKAMNTTKVTCCQ